MKTAARVLAGAARAVEGVLQAGLSFDAALARAAAATGADAGAGRAAVQAVALGTLRWQLRFAPAVLPMAGPRTVPLLRALLCCAVHQLECSGHPAPATVAAAVDAARALGQPRAAGLVNAVLRRWLRERAARLAAIDATPAGRHACPAWLVEALAEAWPAQLEALLAAGNAHPPLAVRVDCDRGTRARWLAECAQAGLEASAVEDVPSAAVLAHAVPVARLPGFEAGACSVQDASAQLAAHLLAPRAGERVLDACAAPGGKSGALLELAGGPIELTALDLDAGRLERVAQNLARLGRSARCVAADLCASPAWWDGVPFDAILLDAPCSGTGVIRRHPDIKHLRRPADVPALAARQGELLRAAFALLRPGGRLLYGTCSVLPAENAGVVGAFLAAEPRARELPLPAPWPAASGLHAARPGWQRLTGEGGGDGFYYALLGRAPGLH